MPSVSYDQSLYRTGFRPSGTDPFAATQMSGIFSPQHLHGMGSFFSPEGGSALHGLGDLGAIVPNGSIITYQGKWPLTSFTGADDILSAVVSAINQSGQLAVRNSASDASWAQNTPPFPLNISPFTVTLQIQVANGMGFGDPNDIISIIRHYVYQVANAFPVADSIPSVQVPVASGGAGAPTSTGQPSMTNAPDPTSQNWGIWLQNNAIWIGAGVVAAMVLPRLMGR